MHNMLPFSVLITKYSRRTTFYLAHCSWKESTMLCGVAWDSDVHVEPLALMSAHHSPGEGK